MRSASQRILVIFSLLLPGGWVQAQGVNVAAAETQFQRGLDEMKAGRLDVACPAFAESYRLDPRPGTLFTQAECETKWGKAATASIHFLEYVSVAGQLPGPQLAKHKERIQLAEERRKQLSSQIAYVTLTLTASAPKTTEVKLDGTVLGAPSLGIELPLDPGDHVASTRVPGGPEREERFSINKGEKKTLTLKVTRPRGADDDDPEPPASASAQAPPPPPASAPASPRGPRVTAGYALGGVGAVSLVVGVITGAMVLQKKNVVDSHCIDTRCDAAGKEAADSARPLALVSTVGFGLGAAGLISGAVLLLTAPSDPPPAADARAWKGNVAVGERGVWFSLGRRW